MAKEKEKAGSKNLALKAKSKNLTKTRRKSVEHPIKTYVLDTSILLSDPRAPLRFAEHHVVLPIAVVVELEAKRHHPELGFFARKALHLLDDLRITQGRLDKSVKVGSQGGTLRVELGLVDSQILPEGMRLGDNDTKILAVAANLAQRGQTVIVVSKDLPMRVKAAAIGLQAQEYRNDMASANSYTGIVYASMDESDMARLWQEGSVESSCLNITANHDQGSPAYSKPNDPPDQAGQPQQAGQPGQAPETPQTPPQMPEELHLDSDEDLDIINLLSTQPVNTGVIMTSSRGNALGVLESADRVRVVRTDREVFGVRGHSAEQRIAIDHLLNPKIGIVSLGGRAGTGKSALALAAGLDAVVERREHRKVMVFRPLYAVGGQSLGFLPGSGEEKMDPWAQAVYDTLSAVVAPEIVEEVGARGQLEVLPLTHIRGRSLHDAFVIVDEAQSLERNVLLTVLSRIGQNAKVVLTHDVSQRDNLRVGRWDGIAAVIEDLKGQEIFAHTTLVRSERSEIADLVTSLLDR